MKRENLNISAYLVVGRENTNGRRVSKIAADAVRAGFTCVQIRSKIATARELMEDCRETADEIKKLGKENAVALLVDDRLDVVLACRERKIKVDGIHVGQSDIPADICRKLLGENAIVGLSAKTDDLIEYAKTADTRGIDYFGAGPLHPTPTKADCGLSASGKIITRSLEEISILSKVSKIPVVLGGGVKLSDIADLKKTGIAGFFVVSAVAGAENPFEEAKKLADAWNF